MSKKLFSAVLAVGLFSATVAVQAATISFSNESTGFYFENVTNLWTGSFTVNNAVDDSGVTLRTDSWEFSFDPVLYVWDQSGNLLKFNNDVDTFADWNSFIDLGVIADGTYYFTIGNWPNMLKSGVTTVDLNNVGASFVYNFSNPNVLHPDRGIGQWNVVVTGVVPEPETWAMLLAGLGIVGAVARRRKLHTV